MTRIDFYCGLCKLDQANFFFLKKNMFVSWFESKCSKCGIMLIRYKENKHLDPYYRYSPKQRAEQDLYKKDLIQPGQEGFRTYYKKQWEEMDKAAEISEKKEIQKKEERDNFYKKYKHNINTRQAAYAAINAEEKFDA